MSKAQAAVRAALWHRIQHGTMSLALLSRRSGYTMSHLSNFVHSKRGLSARALEAVAQSIGFELAVLPVPIAPARTATNGPGRPVRLPRAG